MLEVIGGVAANETSQEIVFREGGLQLASR